MRRVIVASAAVFLAAGCGSHTSSTGGAAPSGSLEAIYQRPGEDVALVAGASDFAVGSIRFPFLVIRRDAKPVYRPQARVWVASGRTAKPFERSTAVLEPIGVPGISEPAAGDVSKIYVAHLRIRQPGRYWVVAEPVGGTPIQAIYVLDVKRRTASIPVGSKAFPSRTPTLASTHADVAQLTTRTPPDRPLLQYSVAGSLAARRPFVATFATPRFCESRTCGPVVDVLERVHRQFAHRRIRFIHVEVYRDNKPALGYNRWMREWGLESEPWVFLVGSDGRVKAKYEGSVSAAELAGAVRRLLLPSK